MLPLEFVEIPYKELSAEALRSIIEEFVLREGTEYGARDFSLEEKIQHVLRRRRGATSFPAERWSVHSLTSKRGMSN
jgi:uncharacterized protein YheU (UPF0270 family)